MKFSIITPSFNQGKFIQRTIESVLGQRGDFELEYIIVDGGSTDRTLDIIKGYGDKITWISEKDHGQSDAINKGFAMASGDILAWLNSDDTYEPGALASVAEGYKRIAFKWCMGKCRIINEHDFEIRKWITLYKSFKCAIYSYKRLLAQNFISQPAVFFTKKIYKEMGPLCLDCHYAMDYDYWLRIGQKYNPLYINKYLANFRWHSESKCGKHYRDAAYEAYSTARKYAMAHDRLSIVRQYIHYRLLSLIYRLLDT